MLSACGGSDHNDGVVALPVLPAQVAVSVRQDSGKTLAEAAAQAQASLGLSASPMTDFTVASAASAATPAAKVVEAGAAVAAQLNLSASTVKAVADQLVRPAGIADALGPFVSVRRFAYTDANHYSYTLFTGDSSPLDGDGRFTANEVRKTVSAGANLPFNRNQRYWTGTGWKTCALQWQVVTTKLGTATTPQTSSYCGGSRSESKVATDDITGKTLREVITKIRAYPLAEGVSASTHPISGLPVNCGARRPTCCRLMRCSRRAPRCPAGQPATTLAVSTASS